MLIESISLIINASLIDFINLYFYLELVKNPHHAFLMCLIFYCLNLISRKKEGSIINKNENEKDYHS
jgi:hypothetical protein